MYNSLAEPDSFRVRVWLRETTIIDSCNRYICLVCGSRVADKLEVREQEQLVLRSQAI